MLVLLTGASGFIGRHLLRALLAQGHTVRCAVRNPERMRASFAGARVEAVHADFVRDLEPEAWMARLQNVDVVINAVGILREQGDQSFDALHARAPCALFQAAAAAGVHFVVQISALGADEAARSGYHLSKKRADDCLAALPLKSVIVQPSVVFGVDGSSARLFSMLASLPLIGLPGGGRQQIQPVHIDDLCQGVLALIDQVHRADEERPVLAVSSDAIPNLTEAGEFQSPAPAAPRLAMVGPQALTLRDYLAQLRSLLGLGRALFVPIPQAFVRLGASIAARLPGSLLDHETLDMLERGNAADPAPFARVLSRSPRSVQDFLTHQEASSLSTRARLDWLLPLLRVALALVWIVTGIVSLGVYPVEDSYALLARTGITGALAPLALYGAALLDLAIGIGILALKRRRWLWYAQMVLIAGYTVIISLRLPEFWLHPYGPILKNLPMLAAIWLMAELDGRRN
ncbi:MAG TPA: SDR family oxidoreductase [Noviherbaspirillum sp.]